MTIMWKPKLGKRASFPGTPRRSLSFQNGECICNISLSDKSIDFLGHPWSFSTLCDRITQSKICRYDIWQYFRRIH